MAPGQTHPPAGGDQTGIASLAVQRPWVTVAAMAVAVGVGPGALVPFALGTFIKAVAADYGWGRGEVSAGIGVFTFTLAFGMPWFGWVVDRFGARRSAMSSVLLLSIGMAAMSTVKSPTAFMLIFAIMGLVGGGATGLPYSKSIAAMFTKRRGLAFGLGAAGLGLGGIALPHISGYLLENHGWRGGFLGLAGVLLLFSLPAAFMGLPRSSGETKARGAPPEPFRPWTQPTIWIIGASLAIIAASVGGMMVHGIALLTDRGFSGGLAAGVISAVAVSSIVGRVAGGYLMDRFFAPRVAGVVFLLAAAGAAMLLFGGSPVWWGIALICIGFVAGADVDVMTYLVSRYCSQAHFGKLFGLMMFIFTSSSGLGVYVMGAAHDHFGSYGPSLALSAILAVCAAIVITRLGPYTTSIED